MPFTCCKKRQGPRHGFKIVDNVAAGKSKARAKLCRVDYPRIVGERAAPVLDYAGNAKEGIADCGVVRSQRHESGKPVGEILIVVDRHVHDGAEPGAVKHSKAYIGAAHIGQQNGVRLVTLSHSPSICIASTADRDRSRVGGHENDTALGAAAPLWGLGFAQNRRPVRGYNMAAPKRGVEICQPVARRL
jgi:hypothetical protein